MVNTTQIFSMGIIASIAWFILGGALYMNPIVAKQYKKYANHPCMRKWDNQKKYLGTMYLVGALIPCLISSFVYSLISPISIFYFGLILVGIRIIPRYFDMWIQSTYPKKLLYIEIINGTILSFMVALIFAFMA